MIKCDPKAFMKCPVIMNHCKTEAEAYFCDGSDCHKFNQKILSEPKTNADRIRAMSDEELAKAIASKTYTGACNDFDIPYDGKCCHNCEKCDAIIKWLKQPAE